MLWSAVIKRRCCDSSIETYAGEDEARPSSPGLGKVQTALARTQRVHGSSPLHYDLIVKQQVMQDEIADHAYLCLSEAASATCIGNTRGSRSRCGSNTARAWTIVGAIYWMLSRLRGDEKHVEYDEDFLSKQMIADGLPTKRQPVHCCRVCRLLAS